MTYDDIVSTLLNLDMLVKDEQGEYVIRVSSTLIDAYLEKCAAKGYPSVKPHKLRWSPFFAKTGLAGH